MARQVSGGQRLAGALESHKRRRVGLHREGVSDGQNQPAVQSRQATPSRSLSSSFGRDIRKDAPLKSPGSLLVGLEAFLHSNKLASYKNGKWRTTDRRVREMEIISTLGYVRIEVRGFNAASLGMRHRAAVQHFLDSNDPAPLSAFEGVIITDTSKQKYTLETRPNVLLRLANAGSDADMKIYRLI
jgi:hypothetical protein